MAVGSVMENDEWGSGGGGGGGGGGAEGDDGTMPTELPPSPSVLPLPLQSGAVQALVVDVAALLLVNIPAEVDVLELVQVETAEVVNMSPCGSDRPGVVGVAGS